MTEIGQYNILEIKTKTDVGFFLSDGREDILLPKRYTSNDMKVGESIEVFVYLDNENRPIATTLKPFACVGEFAFLRVKEVNAHGTFLDWGIAKDIFIPYSEQRQDLETGKNIWLIFLSMIIRTGLPRTRNGQGF